jgi:hypothetical protein
MVGFLRVHAEEEVNLLWLLLAATVETGASRLQNGTGRASRLQNGTGKK